MLRNVKLVLLCSMLISTLTMFARPLDAMQSESTTTTYRTDNISDTTSEKRKIFKVGFFIGYDLPTYRIMPEHDEKYFSPDKIGFGMSMGFVLDFQLCRFLNLRILPEMSFVRKNISGRLIDVNGNFYEVKSLGVLSGIDENGESYITNKYAPIEKVSIASIPLSLPILFKISSPRISRAKPYIVAGGGASIDILDYKNISFLPFKPHMFDVFVDVGVGCEINLRIVNISPEIRYRAGFYNQMTTEKYWNKTHWEPQWEDIEESWYHPTDNVGPYLLYTGNCNQLFNQKLSLVINIE